MRYEQTIQTLINQGCAVRGVKIRFVEWCNIFHGTVEYIDDQGWVHVIGNDLFGPRQAVVSASYCELA